MPTPWPTTPHAAKTVAEAATFASSNSSANSNGRPANATRGRPGIVAFCPWRRDEPTQPVDRSLRPHDSCNQHSELKLQAAVSTAGNLRHRSPRLRLSEHAHIGARAQVEKSQGLVIRSSKQPTLDDVDSSCLSVRPCLPKVTFHFQGPPFSSHRDASGNHLLRGFMCTCTANDACPRVLIGTMRGTGAAARAACPYMSGERIETRMVVTQGARRPRGNGSRGTFGAPSGPADHDRPLRAVESNPPPQRVRSAAGDPRGRSWLRDDFEGLETLNWPRGKRGRERPGSPDPSCGHGRKG